MELELKSNKMDPNGSLSLTLTRLNNQNIARAHWGNATDDFEMARKLQEQYDVKKFLNLFHLIRFLSLEK